MVGQLHKTASSAHFSSPIKHSISDFLNSVKSLPLTNEVFSADVAQELLSEAAVEDNNGNLEYYAVRFVVEERKNQNPILAEANVLGKLYGANAKKIGSLILGSLPKSNVARIYTQPIKHSVADFLQSVKTLPITNEVFSVLYCVFAALKGRKGSKFISPFLTVMGKGWILRRVSVLRSCK